jgi:hypothetical protein
MKPYSSSKKVKVVKRCVEVRKKPSESNEQSATIGLVRTGQKSVNRNVTIEPNEAYDLCNVPDETESEKKIDPQKKTKKNRSYYSDNRVCNQSVDYKPTVMTGTAPIERVIRGKENVRCLDKYNGVSGINAKMKTRQ